MLSLTGNILFFVAVTVLYVSCAGFDESVIGSINSYPETSSIWRNTVVKHRATAGTRPWGKYEHAVLKPVKTRIKKVKLSKWPLEYGQLQSGTTSKKKRLALAATKLPGRYMRIGFDLTTLLAVSLMSALLGALTYSVVDAGGRGSSVFSFLNMVDPDAVTKTLAAGMDWLGKTDEGLFLNSSINKFLRVGNTTVLELPSNNGNSTARSTRGVRETKTGQNPGLWLQWYTAYRKDPNELRCIQKLICESLEASSCAARTINSSIGGSIMNAVKYFVGSAGDVANIVTQTVDNPSRCKEIRFLEDFCNSSSEPGSQPQRPNVNHPIPKFNTSSIVPRSRATLNVFGKLPGRNSTRLVFQKTP